MISGTGYFAGILTCPGSAVYFNTDLVLFFKGMRNIHIFPPDWKSIVNCVSSHERALWNSNMPRHSSGNLKTFLRTSGFKPLSGTFLNQPGRTEQLSLIRNRRRWSHASGPKRAVCLRTEPLKLDGSQEQRRPRALRRGHAETPRESLKERVAARSIAVPDRVVVPKIIPAQIDPPCAHMRDQNRRWVSEQTRPKLPLKTIRTPASFRPLDLRCEASEPGIHQLLLLMSLLLRLLRPAREILIAERPDEEAAPDKVRKCRIPQLATRGRASQDVSVGIHADKDGILKLSRKGHERRWLLGIFSLRVARRVWFSGVVNLGGGRGGVAWERLRGRLGRGGRRGGLRDRYGEAGQVELRSRAGPLEVEGGKRLKKGGRMGELEASVAIWFGWSSAPYFKIEMQMPIFRDLGNAAATPKKRRTLAHVARK